MEKIDLILNEIQELKEAILGTKNVSNEYYNVDEAAEFLKIPKSTLYVHLCHKKINGIKKGKRWYFKKSDLIEFVENGQKNQIDEPHTYLKKKGGQDYEK